MKKLLSILCLIPLLISSCVVDDLEACSGMMNFSFSYQYGGTNRFFELVEGDIRLGYYKGSNVYRQTVIDRSKIAIDAPWKVQKTPQDVDSIGVWMWSNDEALEYVDPTTDLASGYVHLKEMTPGSGICRPVKDLFYANIKFDAGERKNATNIAVPCERAVCRIRVTMIPQTLEEEKEPSTRNDVVNQGEYVFQLSGTRNRITCDNVAGGEEVILQPECAFDQDSGNVLTEWFGAIPSGEEDLKVTIFLDGKKIAFFDCGPVDLKVTPGRFIDLVVDGRYVHPRMEIRVNGWKVAEVKSNM